MKKQPAANKPVKRSRRKQVLPAGWNEKRVQEVAAYYDNQTEDEGVAEYEAAMKVEGLTVMIVPTDLVPAIRQLIGRRRGA
jgi:hypothetical protein